MGDRRLTLVGTYTGGKSRGIYALWLDPAAGRFESIGPVAEGAKSFIPRCRIPRETCSMQ